jgi:hypothetical protein
MREITSALVKRTPTNIGKDSLASLLIVEWKQYYISLIYFIVLLSGGDRGGCTVGG